MTTAPTPSRADALIREHRASMHPDILRAWASDAVDELGRLLAQVHKLEMQALDLASENSILKRAETDELEARKPLPLSDEQIERLREQAFSTNNPFCPCDSKTMRKAARATERAHGITGGSS